MRQRMLMTSIPLEGSPLDPLGATIFAKSVEDAIRRVTVDLEKMSQRYVRDGWKADGDAHWFIAPGDLLVGQLFLRRDDA